MRQRRHGDELVQVQKTPRRGKEGTISTTTTATRKHFYRGRHDQGVRASDSPGQGKAGELEASLAAWIGSLPLVAYYFNIVTPVSTPANVLAVPLCALVLISNLASLLLAGGFPAAVALFNHAGWFLMEVIRVSSNWFAHWPDGYFYVPVPSLFTSGLHYLVLLSVCTGWILQPKLRAWKIAVPLGASGHSPRSADILVRFGCRLTTLVLL